MGVRKIEESDWPDIKMIYQLGIDTKVATFETSPPNELYSMDKKN